jgi:hypothetical protein
VSEGLIDFPYYDEPYDDEEEEEFFDCHMGADGNCGAAGSEECEFECPYRADQIRKAERRERDAECIRGGA